MVGNWRNTAGDPWRHGGSGASGPDDMGSREARDICRDYVIEHYGDPPGVLVWNETGFLKEGHLKKGSHSIGVARQYSGTVGRSRTVQIGVLSAMRSKGMLDRPPSLSAKGLDRGRGASKSSQYFATM